MFTIRLRGGPYDGAEWQLASGDPPMEIRFRIRPAPKWGQTAAGGVKLNIPPEGAVVTATYIQSRIPQLDPVTKDLTAIYEPSPPARFWDEPQDPA